MRYHTTLGALAASFALVATLGCGQSAGTDSQSQSVNDLACSPSSPPAGSKTALDLTAHEVWDPTGQYFGTPVGSFPTVGSLICPGTEPLDPYTCPAGSRKIERGLHIPGVAVVNTTIPIESPDHLTGTVSIVANSNFDATLAGQVFGTWHEDIAAGGTWDGTFTGTAMVGGVGCPENSGIPCWTQDVKLVGCGTSGVADGMHFDATVHIVEFQLAFLEDLDIHIR